MAPAKRPRSRNPRGEKAVIQPPNAKWEEEIETWIYTVRVRTGEVLKLEHVDHSGAERKEIPLDQGFHEPFVHGSQNPGVAQQLGSYPMYGYPYHPYFYYHPYWWGG